MKKLKARADYLKTSIPAVFIALKKPETPFIAKMFAGITVAYALSPIDLIPDFIPVLGYLDDVIILPTFIVLTIKLIPLNIFEQCKEEADALWKDKIKGKLIWAIPVILLWTAILLLIFRRFLK